MELILLKMKGDWMFYKSGLELEILLCNGDQARKLNKAIIGK